MAAATQDTYTPEQRETLARFIVREHLRMQREATEDDAGPRESSY